MQNPENDSAAPNTFEQRATRMQETITRFVELHKTSRSNIQLWDNNEPSTSSESSNTARHHYIPGDKFRDIFLNMLSNQLKWPFMVQMLNAALENYHYHGSQKKLDILNAQNALNMFDERIPDCDFDVDSLFESLEDLYAVFYWTPFNIYFGPLPHMRAPLDEGNNMDKNLSPGIDIVTTFLSQFLEHQFQDFVIDTMTVKCYLTLLFCRPTPEVNGCYRKIYPSYDDYVADYLEYKMGMVLNTKEFDDAASTLRKYNTYNFSNGDTIHHELIMMFWLTELESIKACKECLDSAVETEVVKSNCRVKKCPYSSRKPKYALHSFVKCSSIETLLFKSICPLLFCIFLYHVKKLLVSLQNADENSENMVGMSEPIAIKILNGTATEEEFRSLMKNNKYAVYFDFLFKSENLDYEYKILKKMLMEDKEVLKEILRNQNGQ